MLPSVLVGLRHRRRHLGKRSGLTFISCMKLCVGRGDGGVRGRKVEKIGIYILKHCMRFPHAAHSGTATSRQIQREGKKSFTNFTPHFFSLNFGGGGGGGGGRRLCCMSIHDKGQWDITIYHRGR